MGTFSETLLQPTEAWRKAHLQACVGILTIDDLYNPLYPAALESRKPKLAADLREKYAGMDRASLRKLPVLKAYAEYYRRFNKTYHVQLQLESVVLKGKSFPRISPLVDAMFMAELDSLLLTAGHDLASVRGPVRLDTADGHETYTCLQGKTETLKSGDMYMADQLGVISSILYGPDRRTRIRPGTQRVLYTVYAPPGISPAAVMDHLVSLNELVRLVYPDCASIELKLYHP